MSLKACTGLLFGVWDVIKHLLLPQEYCSHSIHANSQGFGWRGNAVGKPPVPGSCALAVIATSHILQSTIFSSKSKLLPFSNIQLFSQDPNTCLIKSHWLELTSVSLWQHALILHSIPLKRSDFAPKRTFHAHCLHRAAFHADEGQANKNPSELWCYSSWIFFFCVLKSGSRQTQKKKATPARCGKCYSLHLEALCKTYTLANDLHLPQFSFLPEFSLLPALVQSSITSARRRT